MTVPENYWIVETTDSRIPVNIENAAKVREAVTGRLAMVGIKDLFGAAIHLIPRQVTIIYESSHKIRTAAREHGFYLELETKEDRAEYFQSRGIVDPQL